jgi:hypothetical protein
MSNVEKFYPPNSPVMLPAMLTGLDGQPYNPENKK